MINNNIVVGRSCFLAFQIFDFTFSLTLIACIYNQIGISPPISQTLILLLEFYNDSTIIAYCALGQYALLLLMLTAFTALVVKDFDKSVYKDKNLKL